jgi:TonB family protein
LKLLLLKSQETTLANTSPQHVKAKEVAQKFALGSSPPSYFPRNMSTYPGGQNASIHANTRNMPQWYLPYDSDFQRRIRRAWFPPTIATPTQSIILFNISKNGILESVKLQKSSGNTKLDDSCLEAIKNARFRTLPLEAPNKMRFQITFLSDGRGSRHLDLVWTN